MVFPESTLQKTWQGRLPTVSRISNFFSYFRIRGTQPYKSVYTNHISDLPIPGLVDEAIQETRNAEAKMPDCHCLEENDATKKAHDGNSLLLNCYWKALFTVGSA